MSLDEAIQLLDTRIKDDRAELVRLRKMQRTQRQAEPDLRRKTAGEIAALLNAPEHIIQGPTSFPRQSPKAVVSWPIRKKSGARWPFQMVAERKLGDATLRATLSAPQAYASNQLHLSLTVSAHGRLLARAHEDASSSLVCWGDIDYVEEGAAVDSLDALIRKLSLQLVDRLHC